MRYEIRPLGSWTDPVTEGRRSAGTFRASWADTLDLLRYETELLGATLVVLQVDVVSGDIRQDGMLRANARVGFPGVRVSFDSRFGPLTYATDAFAGWQANIRAIALSLVALRAVDRYGVTRRGEQYTGWTQIPAKPEPLTPERAAGLLAAFGGGTPAEVLADPDARARAYKRARREEPPRRGRRPRHHGADQRGARRAQPPRRCRVMARRTEPRSSRVRLHYFVHDFTVPLDDDGRAYCQGCGLPGGPGDVRHLPLPDPAGQAEHRRRAGEPDNQQREGEAT